MAPDGSRVVFTVRLQPTENQDQGEAGGSSSGGAEDPGQGRGSSSGDTATPPCYPAAAGNGTAGQTSGGCSGVYGGAGGAVGPAAFRTSAGGPADLGGANRQPLPNGLPNVKVNRTKTNESMSLTFDLSPSLTLTLAPTLGLSQNPTAAPILQASTYSSNYWLPTFDVKHFPAGSSSLSSGCTQVHVLGKLTG